MTYFPHPRDDLRAGLLLVNCWIFRSNWEGVLGLSERIVDSGTHENHQMEEFWEGIEHNPLWSRANTAAMKCDYKRLENVLYVLH